jgi:hypothetical protein
MCKSNSLYRKECLEIASRQYATDAGEFLVIGQMLIFGWLQFWSYGIPLQPVGAAMQICHGLNAANNCLTLNPMNHEKSDFTIRIPCGDGLVPEWLSL